MSDMKSNNQMDRLLAEQSSEWIERLKRGNARDRAEFAEWTGESRRHLRHFLMMAALEKELETFDPERKLPVPDLTKQGAEVVQLGEHAMKTASGKEGTVDKRVATAPFGFDASPAKRFAVSRWWSLAAVLVLFIGLATITYLLPRNDGWEELSTTVGEQRSVELADGSVVHLNTGTRVAVRLSENARDIRLLEGEALFKVHHDASRPFRVHTERAVIQAIGTQFNVYRGADGTTVSVVEGRVQISAEDPRAQANGAGSGAADVRHAGAVEASDGNGAVATAGNATASVTRLAAGEGARIDAKGRIEPQRDADITRATAWRERRLIFKQDSLQKIVTEFNRYNQVPQFKLIGTSVATRRYSGAFSVDDPESLSSLLASEPDLLVQRSGNEILVRARLETGSFANSP